MSDAVDRAEVLRTVKKWSRDTSDYDALVARIAALPAVAPAPSAPPDAALDSLTEKLRQVADFEAADAIQALRAKLASLEQTHAAQSEDFDRLRDRLEHAYQTIDTFAGERDAARAALAKDASE